MNLLQALFAIAKQGGGFTMDDAKRLHRELWMAVGWFLLAVLSCFLLNVIGLQFPAIIMTIVFSIAVLWAWTHPWSLLALLGVSWFRKAGTSRRISDEVTGAISEKGWYYSILKVVLFGGTFLLLMLGTVPFERNAFAFGVIIAVLIFLGVMIILWPDVFTGHKGKKIAYGYGVSVLVYSFATLIFGSVWAKLGFEPGELAATKSEKLMLEIKRAKAEVKDRQEGASLKAILLKIQADAPLAPEEKAFLASREGKSEVPAARGGDGGPKTIIAPALYLSRQGAIADPRFGTCAPQALVEVVPFVPQKDGPPARGEPFRDGPGMTSHHSFSKGTIFRFQSTTGKDVEVLCSFPVVDV